MIGTDYLAVASAQSMQEMCGRRKHIVLIAFKQSSLAVAYICRHPPVKKNMFAEQGSPWALDIHPFWKVRGLRLDIQPVQQEFRILVACLLSSVFGGH